MSNFTTTKLTGDRVLITGGKGRRYVADATQFNELNATLAERRAVDRFDQAVSSFFAPLTQAAEAAERETRVAIDPYAYLVLEEGEDSVQGKEAVVVELDVDTQILRMLHLGDTSRLLWVGKDRIEIAARMSRMNSM